MTRYLLPCSCGATTPVIASQAGQAVRCACGTSLEVPTLRGLELLPLEDLTQRTGRGFEWDDRRRNTFVFLLLSLLALIVAGCLFAKLPEDRTTLTDREMTEYFSQASVGEAFSALEVMHRGIDYVPADVAAMKRKFDEDRRLVLGVIYVALGLGILGISLAAIYYRSGLAP